MSNETEKQKFKISIIDFLPQYKKFDIGKYENGSNACLGDIVEYKNEKFFIVYRYGKILLKQVGMMAMIGQEDFERGDFSKVTPTNIVGSGEDWLIIGYTDEPMYKRLKPVIDAEPSKEEVEAGLNKLLDKFKQDPMYAEQQELGKFLMRHIDDLSPAERKRYDELVEILCKPK